MTITKREELAMCVHVAIPPYSKKLWPDVPAQHRHRCFAVADSILSFLLAPSEEMIADGLASVEAGCDINAAETAVLWQAMINAIKSDRAGSVAGRSEHRLSGEQPLTARADHAAGSRSSDGSDISAPTEMVKLMAALQYARNLIGPDEIIDKALQQGGGRHG